MLPFDERLIIDELLRQVDLAFPSVIVKEDNLGFNAGFKRLFGAKTLDISTNVNGDPEISLSLMNRDKFVCTNHKLEYKDFFTTYRDVKRFMNEFKFNASFLDNENDVVAEEYILLKLLTYKYRELQNIIFSRVKYILAKGTIDEANKRIQFLGGSGFKNVYIYNDAVKEIMLLELKANNYSQRDIEIINAALCFLFGLKPLSFYDKIQNSISKIYYTDLYIRNNIATGHISITQLQEAFGKNKLYDLVKEISLTNEEPNFHISNEIKQFIFNNQPGKIEQYLDGLRTLNFILPRSNFSDDQSAINLMSHAFNVFYDKNKKYFINDLSDVINNESLGFIFDLLADINLDAQRAINYKNNPKYDNVEFSSDDLHSLLVNKLVSLIDNSNKPEEIFRSYSAIVEAIVGDQKILFSKEGNRLIQKDIKSRLVEYLKSPVFTTLTEKIDDHTGSFIGYSPHFSLAQIFSESNTLDDLMRNSKDKTLYERFYEEGWRNFNSYVQSIELSEEEISKIGSEKIKNMKEFLQAYIDNDQKPLSKTQYDKIWNELPF